MPPDLLQDQTTGSPGSAHLTRKDLFVIFLRAGLAFGGGLSLLGVLQDEFVTKRRVVSRQEFLSTFGISQIIPSGNITSLSIYYGYRYGGVLGILIALTALVAPAFILIIGLTIAYSYLRGGTVLHFLELTLLPAALAVMVSAAVRLAEHLFRPSVDQALAIAAFAAALWFRPNPLLILVLGGVLGVAASSRSKQPPPSEAAETVDEAPGGHLQ